MNPQLLFRPEQVRQQPRLDKHIRLFATCFLFVVLAGVLLWGITVRDEGIYTLRVESGMTGGSIAATLRNDGVVHSTLAMRAALMFSGRSHAIQAGNYVFDTREIRTVFSLAHLLTTSTPTHDAVMVTIPEGSRGRDILAELRDVMATTTLEGVTAETFDEHIGYLFPDTYAIDETVTVSDLISRMQAQYEANLSPLREKINASGFTEAQVIVLASIVEREAKDDESMRHVAGILRNRLAEGMRLQVDATLAYLLDKTSAELTQEDLALASPYNTYRIDGLPPTPIANPALRALMAVVDPLETSDLFYLTGSDGTFHYAKTFEEHTHNKQLYLHE